MDKFKSVCFSGHRPKSLIWGYNENHKQCKELKEKLKTTILNLINNGYNTFYNGMAEGFDLYAAEILNNLKNQGYNIKIIACLPYKKQSMYYTEKNKDLYSKILKNCDDIYIASNGEYFNGCTIIRNKYMVENSSVLVCYLLSHVGGTANTVNIAKKKGLQIIQL